MIFIFTSNNKQIWWHFLPAYLCPINMWYENWTYHAGSIGQKHFTTTNALWSLSHYPLMWKNIFPYKSELEQLERLRSEILPAAPWLPILVIHIRSQVKTTQSQSYKFWKIAKIPITYIALCDYSSHVLTVWHGWVIIIKCFNSCPKLDSLFCESLLIKNTTGIEQAVKWYVMKFTACKMGDFFLHYQLKWKTNISDKLDMKTILVF